MVYVAVFPCNDIQKSWKQGVENVKTPKLKLKQKGPKIFRSLLIASKGLLLFKESLPEILQDLCIPIFWEVGMQS